MTRLGRSRQDSSSSRAGYTAGDFKHPIKLVTRRRVPVDGTADFRLVFTVYDSPFAYLEHGKNRFRGGSNDDPNETHIFVIRYDGTMSVEAGHSVVHSDGLYSVSSTKVVEQNRLLFLKIFSTFDQVVTQKDLTDGVVEIVKPTEQAPVQVPTKSPSEASPQSRQTILFE